MASNTIKTVFRRPLDRFGYRKPKKRWFSICSVGFAGSKWLATVLHKTPGIACSHGANGPEYDFGFYDYDIPLNARRSHEDYQVERKDSLLISGMLSELEAHFPDRQAFGNVHAYTASELKNQQKRLHRREWRALRHCNLIRHPYAYAGSLHNASQLAEDASDERLNHGYEFATKHIAGWKNDPVLGRAIDKADSGTLRDRLCWAGTMLSLCWTRNVLNEVVSTHEFTSLVAMESLTENPEFFRGFVGDVVGAEFATDDLVKRAFSSGRINSKSINSKERQVADSMMPNEVLSEFPDWAATLLVELVDHHDARQVYEACGYRFFTD